MGGKKTQDFKRILCIKKKKPNTTEIATQKEQISLPTSGKKHIIGELWKIRL